MRVVRRCDVSMALGKTKSRCPERRKLGPRQHYGVGCWHISRHALAKAQLAHEGHLEPSVHVLPQLVEVGDVGAENGELVLRLRPHGCEPGIPAARHKHVTVYLQTEAAVGLLGPQPLPHGPRPHRPPRHGLVHTLHNHL